MSLTSHGAMTDSYSQDDVQQILQLAIAHRTDSEALTRTQLVEIAEELGISSTDLHLAEQEWLVRRGEDQERQVFNLHRRNRLRKHTIQYLIVNAFLVLLNILISGGVSWSLYVILGWGVLLTLNIWKLSQTSGDDYEESFQHWRRRRMFKKSVRSFLDRWMKE